MTQLVWKKSAVTALMGMAAVVMILPFVWMVSSSLKLAGDIFNYPIEWIPGTWDFANYAEVWSKGHRFDLYYWNTIKITASTVAGSLLTSAMAGFAFAKLNFKGRDTLFLLYLATIIIPGQVLLVPRFILFDYMGIINTHLAVIMPGIFTVFGTFLMRQFFTSIPNELLEAAKVDGAGFFRMFWQICLPLTKPALITLLILTFTSHWNEYEGPLIYLRDQSLYTLTLGLTTFVGEYSTDYPRLLAASTCALLPLIVLVAVFQRFFVEGLANTGLKG
ncbi:MAG: sugar transporter ATP-binding protein [Paenibacillaceae bacterium]|jgi:multiple sugar transport system permease protein|nr:sugar transporter ATP-binding protein [Paenibacillaceae bacterium]